MSQLILVPGLAANSVMWRSQLSALQAFAPQVTDVHMRCDSIEEMATALLDEHVGEIILCGASMGGMVAMEAARQAPSRIKGLALLGTNAQPETAEMKTLREAAITLLAQGRVAEVIEPNIAFAFHPDQAANQEIAQAYLDLIMEAGAQQLIRQNRAVIGRPDARLHLPQVKRPVLVMCGDSDQLTPPALSGEIASLIPHAQLVTVPRCGHMLTMEKPEFVNAQLLRWLQSL